jgi:hypothetical protein
LVVPVCSPPLETKAYPFPLLTLKIADPPVDALVAPPMLVEGSEDDEDSLLSVSSTFANTSSLVF